jgi:hypothetical protein
VTVSGDQSATAAGLDVILTSGVGAAQFQTLKSATYNSSSNTTTFDLNGDFAVIPPAGTDVDVTDDPYNLVFYQNTFNHTRNPSYNANDTASTGIQLWNGGYNAVFDSNTVNDTRTGFALWSYGAPIPLYFIDIINNTTNGVQDGVRIVPLTELGSDPNGIGIAIRNNNFTGVSASYEAADSGIQLYQDSTSGSDTLSVIEHNMIAGFPDGIIAGIDPDTLIYENTFILADSALWIDLPIAASGAVIQGNV